VKITVAPVQIGLDDTATDTLTGINGFTWTLNKVALVALHPNVSV
jgi:hypothetical protein